MLIYWAFFLSLFLVSLLKFKYYYLNIPSKNRDLNLHWKLTFILIASFIGLRHQVGGDWFNYIELFNIIKDKNFHEVILSSDPFYGLINWIFSKFEYSNTLLLLILSNFIFLVINNNKFFILFL